MNEIDFAGIESGEAFKNVQFKKLRPFFIIMVIGMAFLVLTIPIKLPIEYPEYVINEVYGTETQKMVMGQVVGDHMHIDLMSDVLGLVFLIVSAVGMLVCNIHACAKYEEIEGDPDLLKAKGLPVRSESLLKPNFRLFRGIIICLVALAAYVFKLVAPFFYSGVVLYGAEYVAHFVSAVCICLGMLHSIFGFTAMCENADNHRNNMLTEIWIVLSCICTFVFSMGAFYQLSGIKWMYTAGKILFLVLTVVGLMSGRHYLYTGEFSYKKTEEERDNGDRVTTGTE